MQLPTTDADWVTRLRQHHDQQLPVLRQLDAYYEGRQPLSYMHPEILAEVGDRIQPVIIFWPQLVIDALEERLDVEGFRHAESGKGDDELWRVWQENGLDEESQLAHVDSLVMRRSYVIVGTNEDDDQTPLVTTESPLEVYAEVDPRTRRVRAAIKRVRETDQLGKATNDEQVTLYLPDRTVRWESFTGSKGPDDVDEHGLGDVPVVPLVNRARLADRYGRSELTPVIPLSDAANKIATDMMVAAEFHAIPLRGIFGVSPDDFQDEKGNRLTALQAIMGRLMAISDSSAKAFEFAASELTNFHSTINALAGLVASIAGLPPTFLGQVTQNPASADAIRSSESRLVKRAERRQRAFGGSWEQVMRLVRRFQTGTWDDTLLRLETIWRDASTPTVAQAADAAVKKYHEGIVTLRQTREDLGYTQAQIAQMDADTAPGTTPRELAEIVQKVYLGVANNVITAAEARALLVKAGADIPIEFPEDPAPPAPPMPVTPPANGRTPVPAPA